MIACSLRASLEYRSAKIKLKTIQFMAVRLVHLYFLLLLKSSPGPDWTPSWAVCLTPLV